MKYSKKIGLCSRYKDEPETRELIRRFMALSLLPSGHIKDNFIRLKVSIPFTDSTLRVLASYMERQWIESTVHSLSSISVYNISIRTNNDCEGYHHRINRIAAHS